MPIFEYRCSQCGHFFERITAKSDGCVHCERCGSKRCEKQFSTFSARVEARHPVPCSSGRCAGAPVASECAGGGCPCA